MGCVKEETAPIVLAGKYELRKVIGEGGSGLVYLAWDRNLERFVAIKAAKAEEYQLKTEMEMLRKLKHAMLPELYDYFYEENWYLVMEYIEGIGLHKVIEQEEKIPEEQACEWIEEILSLFVYLHEQKPSVIYRDLKPENIMVCPDGRLRMVDFGAALSLQYIGKQPDHLAGTYGYAAPEQFAAGWQGENSLDERSDIYTVGAVLYHMLTGYHPLKPPYGIRPVRSLNPELSYGIEWIVKKCTEKEPSKRYQSIEELKSDLQNKERAGRKWRHSMRKQQVYGLKRLEKKIWLTEKKTIGLLGLGLGVALFWILTSGLTLFARENEIKTVLPVIVYNKQGQKLVIQYDSVYNPQGNLVFELEQELFEKQGMQELSVSLTDCITGERKERIFYLQSKNGQESKQ